MTRDQEILNNYKVFCENLDTLKAQHGFGKFALLQKQKVIDVFDTENDAFKAGRALAGKTIFSIQELTKAKNHLGIFSARIHSSCQ